MSSLAVTYLHVLECGREGNVNTHCASGRQEDWLHRMRLMGYFENLVRSYIAELHDCYSKLHVEIMQSSGDDSKRLTSLAVKDVSKIRDNENYGLALKKSNLDYHLRIIAHDAKFRNEVMIITKEESYLTPEEIDAIINKRYEKRKEMCRSMFQSHLEEMRIIRRGMLTHWQEKHASLAVAALHHTAGAPLDDGAHLSLPTAVEQM